MCNQGGSVHEKASCRCKRPRGARDAADLDGPGPEQDNHTLCWAAWDPANALVELSKDFTAKTGIGMKFEFVPWTNFADRFLNELNSKGKLCDLIIGDLQWIGGSAENGHYVKLNDFFAKEGIKMDDFMPATVIGYSEWPKNTPNYWALPAMGDARGWTYRKDWFSKPELQAEFKEKYGRDLAPPKTSDGAEARSPSSSRAGKSTARKSMAPPSSPSAARKASRWAYPTSSTPRLQVRRPQEALRHGRFRQFTGRREGARSSTRRSTSAARRPAIPTPTCRKASTPSNPARWRCR